MATKQKKTPVSKKTRTATKSRAKAEVSSNDQFVNVMVVVFAVLSVAFLVVVIQQYL